MQIISDIPSLTRKVINAFDLHNKKTAFTVAISGIDAYGKGYTANLLQQDLESKGYNVANINIDPWQNPISIRLQKRKTQQKTFMRTFSGGMIFLNN